MVNQNLSKPDQIMQFYAKQNKWMQLFKSRIDMLKNVKIQKRISLLKSNAKSVRKKKKEKIFKKN